MIRQASQGASPPSTAGRAPAPGPSTNRAGGPNYLLVPASSLSSHAGKGKAAARGTAGPGGAAAGTAKAGAEPALPTRATWATSATGAAGAAAAGAAYTSHTGAVGSAGTTTNAGPVRALAANVNGEAGVADVAAWPSLADSAAPAPQGEQQGHHHAPPAMHTHAAVQQRRLKQLDAANGYTDSSHSSRRHSPSASSASADGVLVSRTSSSADLAAGHPHNPPVPPHLADAFSTAQVRTHTHARVGISHSHGRKQHPALLHARAKRMRRGPHEGKLS